ncbi:MAG: SufD family Fe-S cluster assembly protein [Cypionkella sp.]|nr:SufD family Fe-S cluster assembly protein [Cypionkella sp.]
MPFEDIRKAAFARAQTLGAPQKSHEYWRYSDPAMLQGAGGAANSDVFAATEAYRLVFVDGVFDAAKSDTLPRDRVEFSTLDAPADWAKDAYGALELQAQNTIPRPLAAQNTAQATAGVLLRVIGKLDRPISLDYRSISNNYDAILHHCIRVESGGEITVLESGCLPAGANTVMEITLGQGARLHHLRTQAPNAQRRSINHLFASLDAGAQLKSFSLTAEGALTRNEAAIWLAGDDAVAHLAGAALGSGKDAPCHQDDTVFITHDALRGESRQVFKKVLSNGATGVFQGKILVKQGAQKTDGYQISQALLLDDAAQFLAKPELEIYADDVKCSHGSTTGAIDETALFYLRSRGVPVDQATVLLVLSFLADALVEIEDEALRDVIAGLLENWLARENT